MATKKAAAPAPTAAKDAKAAPAAAGAAPAGAAPAGPAASGKWIIKDGKFVDSANPAIVYAQNPTTGQIVEPKAGEADPAVAVLQGKVIPPEDYKITHVPSENKAAEVLSKGGVYGADQEIRGSDGKAYKIKVMKFSKAATLVTSGGSIPAGTLVACPDGAVLTGKKATKSILSDPFYNPVGVANAQDPNVVLATADAQGNYTRRATAAAPAGAAPAASGSAAASTTGSAVATTNGNADYDDDYYGYYYDDDMFYY